VNKCYLNGRRKKKKTELQKKIEQETPPALSIRIMFISLTDSSGYSVRSGWTTEGLLFCG